MQNKFDNLKKNLLKLKEQGLCLALSGGIDSSLLLYLCKDLGVLVITIHSDFQTEDEIQLTKQLCTKYGIRQIVLSIDVFQNPFIINNPRDRCYHCKKMMFEKIIQVASENGCKFVLDGTNFDDLKVYRPGRKALAELGVISPFAVYEITKSEIREYAKQCGLDMFNKPSVPCMATRFPYEEKLIKSKIFLKKKKKKILKKEGFECCRCRLHDSIARIEILPEKFQFFMSKKDLIVASLKSLGLKYITLDLEGFRSGSMDL